MIWLVIGFGLLIGALSLVKWLANAEPSKLWRRVQVGGALTLIILGVGLALTGRLGMAVPLIASAVGILGARRFRGLGGGRAKTASGSKPKARVGVMTEIEALQVLGLRSGATEAEIREAHRRLIIKMHPDQGGSDYLASRINEAKDVLLGR